MPMRRLIVILGLVIMAAAIPTLAQTPACGTVITTPGVTITFDSDMVCAAGFAGTALDILADDVTVEGSGFSIVAPETAFIVRAFGTDSTVVRNLVVSGNQSTAIDFSGATDSMIFNIVASGTSNLGTGIRVYGGGNNQITANTVHARAEGVRIQGSQNNTVSGNDLASNTTGIVVAGGGPGNYYTDNDISGSLAYTFSLSGSSDFVLSGNRYDGSANGLDFYAVDGMVLSNHDFSTANIQGTAISLRSVINSTISNVNASGTGEAGIGIYVYGGGSNEISANTVNARAEGIRVQYSNNNNVTGNNLATNTTGLVVFGAGPGNSFTDNDLSSSTAYSITYSGSANFVLSGNSYLGSANGLDFYGVDGMTLSNLDLSGASIPGTVLNLRSVINSTISDIDASGAANLGIGIKSYGGGANQILRNTVRGRAVGVQIQGSDNSMVSGNVLTDNTNGVIVYGGGAGNSYIDNDLSRSGPAALWLDGGQPGVITGNLIADGSGDGLVLWHSATALVSHNNIYSNSGFQVKADSPIELSDAGQGNFWGRTCLDPLFIAGVDSNTSGVIDSFPYGAPNAWLSGGTPGCGPADNDGDGFGADVDCDDEDPAINPDAYEICDLIDNNCDGLVDNLGIDACGLGVCEHTVDVCVGGVLQECDPFEGATAEVCADGLDNNCNGVVDDAADLFIEADHHLVESGPHPGSTKTPIEGLVVGIYDKAAGSCARNTCGGISWQNYECIVASCDPVTTDVTDSSGQILFTLATGDYLVIGDAGSDKHLGVSASDLVCGDSMHKYLQRLETANGKSHPGKTSKRTGSELLIIEPEYVEWSGVDELYPFVFESAGNWGVTTSVEPPEGFVADHDELAEQVDNELEAVQFTLTDIGSDWVPTGAQHVLDHNGRREVLVSRVGVLVAPGLALAKGLDREGHPLGPDGHPVRGQGCDPRSPRPVEIVGWIEASAVDPLWVLKLRVDETSDFTLAVTRGQGLVERILFEGRLEPGAYELDWDGLDNHGHPLLPGRHWLTLTSGKMTQKEVFIK